MDVSHHALKARHRPLWSVPVNSKMMFCFLLILGACTYIYYLITAPNLSFQDAEIVASLLPNSIKNGAGISFDDIINAFNASELDGDSRPRIVSYFVFILVEKIRLFLWQYFPLTPSLSPLWILTVFLEPILLYKTVYNFTENRYAALLGTGIFLTSAGFLFNITMLFHPAKPLVNFFLILLIYLISKSYIPKKLQNASFMLSLFPSMGRKSSHLKPSILKFLGYNSLNNIDATPTSFSHRKLFPEGSSLTNRTLFFILSIITLALLTDETGLYLFLLLPIFQPDNFILARKQFRIKLLNVAVYCLPLVIYILIALVYIPKVMHQAFNYQFDFLDYLSRSCFIEKISFSNILYIFSTLLETSFIPWPLTHKTVPLMSHALLLSWLDIITLSVSIGLYIYIDYQTRNTALQKLLRKLGLLIILFLIFQMLVVVFHPLNLVVSGYYYGAMYAVLFSLWMAIAVSFFDQKGRVSSLLVSLCVVFIVCMQSYNFSRLNYQYTYTNALKMYTYVKGVVGYNQSGDWHNIVVTQNRGNFAPSDYPSMQDTVNDRSEINRIWKKWNHDRRSWIKAEPISYASLWYITELSLLSWLPEHGIDYLSSNSNTVLNLAKTESEQDKSLVRLGFGPKTTISFLDDSRPLWLTFDLQNDLSIRQTVRITLNKKTLFSLDLAPHARLEKKIRFIAEKGQNHIVFHYSEWNHHRGYNGSGDSRRLSVSFRKLMLTPQVEPA